MRAVGIIDHDEWMENIEQVFRQVNILSTSGSGWVVEGLMSVDVKVSKGKALAGSSYIPTPPKMEKMKRSLNIKNSFDFCILYCVAGAFFPVDQNRKRPS